MITVPLSVFFAFFAALRETSFFSLPHLHHGAATLGRRHGSIRRVNLAAPGPPFFLLRVLSASAGNLPSSLPRFPHATAQRRNVFERVKGTGSPDRCLEPRNSRTTRKGGDMINLPLSVFFAFLAPLRETSSHFLPQLPDGAAMFGRRHGSIRRVNLAAPGPHFLVLSSPRSQPVRRQFGIPKGAWIPQAWA